MKQKLILALCLGMLVLAIARVDALVNVNIEVKPVFMTGEKIYFNYTLTSDTTEQIRYFAAISCPNAPQALLDLKTLRLQKNIPVTETYDYLVVDETIEPQSCSASVAIVEPYNLDRIKQFSIETKPSFMLQIKICKDESCTEKTNMFLKDANIYMDYESSVQNPSLEARLSYPDGTIGRITLPASITASHVGTYNLEVSASKSGYKTVTQIAQFGVIEKQAEIGNASEAAAAEGVLTTVQQVTEERVYPFVITAIVILIIGVLFALAYFLYKRWLAKRGIATQQL
jgi:hypothetical protein